MSENSISVNSLIHKLLMVVCGGKPIHMKFMYIRKQNVSQCKITEFFFVSSDEWLMTKSFTFSVEGNLINNL